MRIWMGIVVAVLMASGCGGPVVGEVLDGTYTTLVPTAEQLALDVGGDLPGGLASLRETGIEQIEVRVAAEAVSFMVDGTEMATRSIVERLQVTDSEGSGPFKGAKEILVLGDGPLQVGSLAIESPVIWPGSFEESPIITLKPRDPAERGPAVSCRGDEPCLLLTSGVQPEGKYEDANNPEVDQNPVSSIIVSQNAIEFSMDSGQVFTLTRDGESATRACAVSETSMWSVPAEVGLAMTDPVLIHTDCPSHPGGAIRMVIMERGSIPVLAPPGPGTDGEFCSASANCLWFAPVD